MLLATITRICRKYSPLREAGIPIKVNDFSGFFRLHFGTKSLEVARWRRANVRVQRVKGRHTPEVAGNTEAEVLLVFFLWISFCDRFRRVRTRRKRRLAFEEFIVAYNNYMSHNGERDAEIYGTDKGFEDQEGSVYN